MRKFKIEDMTAAPDNLTDFLLGPIRKRPAMYLGEAKISNLSTFIAGYMCAKPQDEYFKDNGFIDWFFKLKNSPQTSFWNSPFLDEVGGDEKKALMLYFDYLEKYMNSKS